MSEDSDTGYVALRPSTQRERAVEALWLVIGIPLSAVIIGLQLWAFINRLW